MMNREPLNASEQTILENIRTHGCHVTSVFDPEGNDLNFTYSVGFPATVGQPEVIISGLPSELAIFMINETLDQCRAGLILYDGLEIDGLIDSFDCVARSIPPHRIDAEYFNSAIWFERFRTGLPMMAAFQIVWPGADHGLFPWQNGADLSSLQSAFYESRMLS